MKKVILKKDGLFVEEDLTITDSNGIIGLSQEGWTPLTFKKEDSKEVVLAICPELETEKIDFAVGFAEWISKNERFISSDDKWYNSPIGVIDSGLDTKGLLQLYLTSTTNGG